MIGKGDDKGRIKALFLKTPSLAKWKEIRSFTVTTDRDRRTHIQVTLRIIQHFQMDYLSMGSIINQTLNGI